MTFRFAKASLLVLGLLSAASTAGFAQTPAPAARAESIHRLGSDARQLRFEGETSARTWTIYVTEAQARTRARIRLAYSNAISVMPEVSTLSVNVNDIAVAQTPIAAASDPGGLDVELPLGLLNAGYNTVRIAVSQRHRVDCSLEATYELWTQLDSAASGLSFPGIADAGIATLDDLAAVSPDVSGAVTMHAILPDNADPAVVDNVMKAVEAVAIRAGIVRPNVEIVDAIDQRPGIWVLAGARADLLTRGFGSFLTDHDGAAVSGTDTPGRVVVVATGADTAATREAITEILPSTRTDERAASTDAARGLAGVNAYPVSGDMRVSLHDLGVQTEEFTGRLFRAGVDILLPADFYPADYDKLQLSISAGYSAGLTTGSQILIRVNDMEAGSLPMRNPKGDLFQDRPISVSLAALRPGVNHLVIEAQTPMKEDAACDVHDLMSAGKRFVLSDRSELVMPRIARIARMPNLAATLSSGFPYQDSPKAWIFLAKHDRTTLGAAATFLARTAFVGRRLVNATPTFERRDLVDGSVLFFGAMDDFNPTMFDEFGVDYHALREAWTRPMAPEGKPEKPAPGAAARPRPAGDVYDQWAKNGRETPAHFGTEFSFRALYDRYINVHREDFALLRSPPEAIKIPEDSTLLIAQAHSPRDGVDTWTLVAAANATALSRDIKGVVAPSNWNAIEGRAAVFSPKNGLQNFTRSANGYFIPTQTLTPANLRLVAAGWLSSNIDYYVIAVVIAAFVLGVVTLWTARAHGARQ